MTTRRDFVSAAVVVAVSACVDPASTLSRVAAKEFRLLAPRRMDPGELRYSTFAEHVNTRARLRCESRPPVDVKLVELSRHDHRHPTSEQNVEQFSLVFRGPRDRELEQGIFSVEHNAVGSCDLFLVPIGVDENGRYFQAAFSRLV